MTEEKILVIRHGALGDIFFCMQAFQDIRAAFPKAHIAFLTTPAFSPFARSMPWFDAVLEDSRPAFYKIGAWLGLQATFARGNFTRVFDFQHKLRTAIYHALFFGKQVKWSGLATVPPSAEPRHYQEIILQQIRAAGVKESGPLNLDWLAAPVENLALPPAYAVLIPGCSPHLLHKRWPPENYAALAQLLKKQGLAPLLVGTPADAEAIAAIRAQADFCIDLGGKTSLPQLASVLRGAMLAVGNDTGPMHLSAILGTPTLGLLSWSTDPERSRPLGARAAFLKREDLSQLSVEEVQAALLQQ